MDGFQVWSCISKHSQSSSDKNQAKEQIIKCEVDQAFKETVEVIMCDYINVNVNIVIDNDFELLESEDEHKEGPVMLDDAENKLSAVEMDDQDL